MGQHRLRAEAARLEPDAYGDRVRDTYLHGDGDLDHHLDPNRDDHLDAIEDGYRYSDRNADPDGNRIRHRHHDLYGDARAADSYRD